MSELAEVHGEEIPSSYQLLWHILAATVKRFPERDAIVALNSSRLATASSSEDSNEDDDPFERWSYLQLLERVDIVAHGLGHAGCGGPSTALVAITHNTADWGLFFWTAAKLGMVFVPVDPAAASREDELRDLLATVLVVYSVQVVVVEDRKTAQTVDAWWCTSHQDKEQRHHRRYPVKILLSNEKDENKQINGSIGDKNSTPPGWQSPAQIFTQPPCPMRCQFDDLRAGSSGRSAALVIFTSGTTGTPKACVHTHDNIVAQTHEYDPNPDPAFVDRWLVHTPAHHMFAINNALRAWRLGGAVILPSPVFSVAASLRALVRQRCTIMSATPTLVRAILAHHHQNLHHDSKSGDGGEKSNGGSTASFGLSIVSLASTLISPDDVRLCTQSLGCRHAIQAYGMSETGPLVSWCRTDPLLVDGFHPGVGKVLPGASVRVCQPGTRRILRLGQVGELHVSGACVIRGYLTINSTSTRHEPQSSSGFYTDNHDGRQWFVTGDQARIDKDRVVYILGRYKDLIIRGGENIDPAMIERAISATADGIEVQVVGQTDSIAGQVPVAIVKRPNNVSKKMVFEGASALGPRYTLAAVYDVSELGYTEMPVTSLNKPRRQVLAAALAKHIEKREHKYQPRPQDSFSQPPKSQVTQDSNVSVSAENSVIVEKLAAIWHDVCGVRPEPQQDVHTFADSILLLQFCDRVFRLMKVPLYLQDLLDCKDLVSQSGLLLQRQRQLQRHTSSIDVTDDDSKAGTAYAAASSVSIKRHELANVNSINIDTLQCPKELESVAAAISMLPSGTTLQKLIPIRANQYRLVQGQRPQSYHIRLAFHIETLSTAKIREAVQALLSHAQLLRSVLVKSTTVDDDGKKVWQHVLCSEHLVQELVHESQVTTEEEVKSGLFRSTGAAVATDTCYGSDSPLSLPYVFRADVIKCLDTGTHFLILCFNHAVVDAMSLWAVLRNLDHLLQQQQKKEDAGADSREIISAATFAAVALPETVPYALWADLWYQNRDNRLAQASVARLAARLRGISRFAPDILFPPRRAPGWMIANDSGSADFAARNAVRERRRQGDSLCKEGTQVRAWQNAATASVNGNANGDGDSHNPDDRVQHNKDEDDLCFPRRGRVVRLPHLAALQSPGSEGKDGERKDGEHGHGIQADILARCALILFNTRQTRSPYAVFTSWEAGRSWPFVPGWVQACLPPAMAVDGPTTQWRLNMYRAPDDGDDETVLQFLHRIRAEEADLAEHCHAPWDQVKAALCEEAAVAEEASFRQGFVWDVTLGMSATHKKRHLDSESKAKATYKVLEPVSRHDWPDCGLFWNAFMIDKENMYFIASWDTAQLTAAEVDLYCDRLAEALRVLANADNWDRPLREALPKW